MLDGARPVKVLATYSIKGGVGKTTAAVNLAAEAARAGARVLLWDLDPQGAATFFVRVKPRLKGGAERLVSKHGELADHVRATDVAGVDVLPADFSLRHLDLHLDDAATGPARRPARRRSPATTTSPCSTARPGITLTSEGVFDAADALLVPTIPSTLSARTLEQLDRVPRPHRRPADRAAVPLDDRPAAHRAPRGRRRPRRRRGRTCCRRRSRTSPPSSGWASSGRRSPASRRRAAARSRSATCGPRSPPASGTDARAVRRRCHLLFSPPSPS